MTTAYGPIVKWLAEGGAPASIKVHFAEGKPTTIGADDPVQGSCGR